MNTVKINVKKVKGLRIPEQAKPYDAGWDVFASTDPEITGELVKIEGYENVGIDGVYSDLPYIQYGTGLFISPQDQVSLASGPFGFGELNKFWTMFFPRSSISKYNLMFCNSFGAIDTTYRGEVMLRYKYIPQPSDYVLLKNANNQFYGLGVKVNRNKIYKKGDAIAQITAFKNVHLEWNIVDSLDVTSRGEGSFGSTGNNSR